MDDLKGVLGLFLSAYSDEKDYHNTIILSGESGIGKTYYSRKFIDLISGEAYVVNINGLPLEQGAYSTINSSIYKHITEHLLKNEIALSLLQKLAAGIPRFGQYISPFFDANKKYEALINLVKRSGINPSEPNIFNIIDFFEDLAKKKKIILYCDNIQWFDKESLALLFSLISNIDDKNWFCIFLYTTNAEITGVSHHGLDSLIYQLKSQNPQVLVHSVKRIEKPDIEQFCSAILGMPVDFSDEQITLLFEYSKGIPYYIKTVLEILRDKRLIHFANNAWGSNGNWRSDQIKEILKDSVKERITSIYRKIPESRNTLELASVFGEEFEEDAINDLFGNTDSFSLLSSIEAKFRLIQYLTEDRLWIFEHSLVQNYIYRSLGNKAKEFHYNIATYLEKGNSPNFQKIAIHFQQAGHQEKAIIYQLKEIEALLNSGCYNAASELADRVENDWIGLFILNDEKKIEFGILKAQIKFYTVKYEEAIRLFLSMLQNSDIPKALKANCQRFLGRTFLKLSTQHDFQLGLQHLNLAKSIYEDLNNKEQLGAVYADLVVAYAHLNDIKEAEMAFKKAERYFNQTKNIIGMLKLQRKNPIFMPPRLSAPLLARTAEAFKKLNIPHEQIMTCNNAATQFIYAGDVEKADLLLQEALSISVNLGVFGQVYIYNNLGIISYVKNDPVEAARYFELGRNGKFRLVEQLIIDVNESVVLTKKMQPSSMESIFERLYKKAFDVGENDYIVPAGINLAKCLIGVGKLLESRKLLLDLKDRVSELNSDYDEYLWYSAFHECCAVLNDYDELAKLNELSASTIDNANHCSIYKSEYALITMQFWSDN